MKRNKISLIGGGQIGGNLALLAAQKELGDILIYDIPNAEGMIKGKALDISQLTPLDGYDANITGSSNPEDLKEKVFLEEDLPEVQRSALAAGTGPLESSVKVIDYEENRVLIEVSNNLSGVLVLTDRYFPGWQVLINDRQGTVYQANYLFRAVFLGKGKNRIEFSYKPRSVAIGIVISILTLVTIVKWKINQSCLKEL